MNGGEHRLSAFPLTALDLTWPDLVSGLEHETGFRQQGIKAGEERLGLSWTSSKGRKPHTFFDSVRLFISILLLSSHSVQQLR